MFPIRSVLFLRLMTIPLGFNLLMTFIGIFRAYGRAPETSQFKFFFFFSILYFLIGLIAFSICLSHLKLLKLAPPPNEKSQ